MTDAEILTRVKKGLGITGEFQNETLAFHISEVKEFLTAAGVPASVVTSEAAVGCIMRGVADLWNYGNGSTSLSEYFRQRMLQLKATTVETDEGD